MYHQHTHRGICQHSCEGLSAYHSYDTLPQITACNEAEVAEKVCTTLFVQERSVSSNWSEWQSLPTSGALNWWNLRVCAHPWRANLGIILLRRVPTQTSNSFDAQKFCLTCSVSFLCCSFVSKKIKVNPLCQTAHDEIQQVASGQAQPLQHNPTKARWWADCISNTVASCECELPLVGEVFGVALKCTADEVGEPFVIIA